MKAFTLDSFDAAPGLRDDLPEPSGERIVRVQASSVNPVDAAISGGMLRGMAEYRFPVILGRDYAGTIAATGEEVFGFVPHADPDVGAGSWAERIALSPYFAPKPASLTMAEAGAAPLAGITALLSVEALGPLDGRRVLIVGATGGVDSFAVQLAARWGATVIAPALPDDRDYLEALGASEVPERGSAPAADAVIDLVSYSPEQLAANAGGLVEGGKTVSALGAGEVNVMAVSDPEAPARLAKAIDELGLQVPIARSFAFDELGAALAALGSHTRGKVSLVLDADELSEDGGPVDA
jgi:NADPH:quinone reductase-like Zn-dependent oxidoreductase